MVAEDSGRSPLARLVLVMVCLAAAGSIIAGMHFFAADPARHQVQPPDNGNNPCRDACVAKWVQCKVSPPVEYGNPELECMNDLGKCYREECGM